MTTASVRCTAVVEAPLKAQPYRGMRCPPMGPGSGAAGLSVILFEKRELGGVCLNEGCIPTKTLLYSAKLYEHATLSQKYGITSEGVTADYGKIADRKDKVVKKLVGAVRVKMRDAGVDVEFQSFPGDHEWQPWRKSLAAFARMLFK